MNQWQRLLFYIVINVIVSACVTLAVLLLWDRTHQSVSIFGDNGQSAIGSVYADPTTAAALTPIAGPAETQAPVPTVTAGAVGEVITIDSITGAGILEDEVVVLKRINDGELNLEGWQLSDGNGNTFVFPSLTLYKDGAIQVHSAAGMNTVVDLYWGSSTPVWESGETVTLTDPQGNVQATYQVP